MDSNHDAGDAQTALYLQAYLCFMFEEIACREKIGDEFSSDAPQMGDTSRRYFPFGTEEKCHMEIFLLDARGNKVGTQISHKLFSVKRRFKLISESVLRNPASKLLSYDQLTVHFLLRSTKAGCEIGECHYPVSNCHRLKLTSDFADLFTSKMNADVVFRVQNTDIAAHKTILTARSPVFAAMFQHQTKDNESGEVDVPDVTPAAFNKLLQFIYTADCQLEDSAEELLMAADKYDIQGLKQFCEFELSAWALNVDTAIYLLILSDLHNAQILRRSVVHFIKKNIAQMMKKPEWAYFKKNYEHLARTFDVQTKTKTGTCQVFNE
jgi:hypothetical protein